jgi:hypothetical protein
MASGIFLLAIIMGRLALSRNGSGHELV